ncbi:helicase conserved Cterminal domain containing protein [Acanthamoeba castellanii str. Neff]|uniref:Helicase conserved Cterminal domain containing protein n=1 Tax=Acanthamoeba castellanii (strain ATCC 30010 / Neff) TaxID=1257118 RepID=L8GQZ6_ACACF|nr:helicase conserved Cterminal domain containing protein [Acanthamoeba castellanii str. Neff]ELR14551.1 helicase conserved Cterminal domain containing protein [Acanthamoeba castellanii str. Neff]
MENRDQRQKDEVAAWRGQLSLAGMNQFYVDCAREEWKYETLCDLFNIINLTQAIVYCNTADKATWLAAKLASDDFSAGAVHGLADATDTRAALTDFRVGKVRVLVVTDSVLINSELPTWGVSLTVNYDLPANMDDYLVRIGRSGRFGRRGVAIDFVTEETAAQVRQLEEYYNTAIPPLPSDLAFL